MTKKLICVFTFCVVFLSVSTAKTDEPEPQGQNDKIKQQAFSSSEVEQRLNFIEYSFEKGNAYSNIWYWGWTAVQLGGAGLFGTLAYVKRDEPGAVENYLVSASQGLLGGAMLIVMPLDSAFMPRRLRNIPAKTDKERAEKLLVAEQMLKDSSKGQKLGRHWINHVLGFGIAAAGGLLLTFAFDDTDWKDGLFNFGLTFGVTEIMIWTSPMRSVRDYKIYQDQYGIQKLTTTRLKPRFFFVPGLNNWSLNVSF